MNWAQLRPALSPTFSEKRKSLVRPSLRRNRADGSTPPHDAIRANQQTFAPEVVGAKLQDKNEFEVDDRLVPAAARTNIQQLPDNTAGCLVPRSHIPSMRAFRMHPQDPPTGVLGCPDEGTACCTQRQPSITSPLRSPLRAGWLTYSYTVQDFVKQWTFVIALSVGSALNILSG